MLPPTNGGVMARQRIETKMDWDGRQWIVMLLRDGSSVCEMTLDEFAQLSATRCLIDDAIRQTPAPEAARTKTS